MYATFTLSKDELNIGFINQIKNLIETDQMIISVESHDETEYLSRSSRNHKMLIERMKYVDEGKDLIEVKNEEIEKML